ncbi:MAG: ATP-NAD kinase family protein [Gammaproteobacteria bacterium]|nr:ATP-NAD kinase family protein [Gammaproteobacteria bacterium]MCP4881982.1 ATP-NAD kinase family protein [Gammaproteobacteria bacterium]
MTFKLGLIVNPLAGLGGSVGLKGTDGVAKEALAKGAVPRANERCQIALKALSNMGVEVFCWANDMGESCARSAGLPVRVLGKAATQPSTAADTLAAAQGLLAADVDVVMFAGGDGTARDLLQAIGEQVPVVGVPAGVKIHSGVYGITPKAAGEVVAQLVRGELVSLRSQEVRDIDEVVFRQGRVKSQYYGELLVPEEHQYMQATKSSGVEVEELVLQDIADFIIDNMQDDTRYIMGSGSTIAAVMQVLGLENTLLGVDVVENGQLLAKDVGAEALLRLCHGHSCEMIITLIGGQGHVFGRGNQQLSAPLIRQIGLQNIHILATKTKLKALHNRPLLVDTGDPVLDAELQGVVPVTCGYNDQVLYPIGNPHGR